MSNLLTVYVALLDDGTDVWRPVPAERVRPAIYRLVGTVPDEERWRFQPGETVRCEERFLSGGRVLVAVERVD